MKTTYYGVKLSYANSPHSVLCYIPYLESHLTVDKDHAVQYAKDMTYNFGSDSWDENKPIYEVITVEV